MRILSTIALLTCLSLSLTAQTPEKLNDGIRVGDLKGFDQGKIADTTKQILDGKYQNIHSLLIFKNGKLVYENYFTGDDHHRENGRPLGIVKHTRETLHDLRSVTKSVVALAILHAITSGKIKSLDELAFDIFPEQHLEGDKKLITIRHLLTMSAGFEWNENVSYDDPANSERLLNRAKDPIALAFSPKLVSKPGAKFNYNGGVTQILAEIVRRKTGAVIDEYVAKNLFAPLGIANYTWVKMDSGDPSAASGLRLRSRDIAKLGLLVWQEGRWRGKRLIESSLIRDAVSRQITGPNPDDPRYVSLSYGYQMWVPGFRVAGVPLTVTYFHGNGGQLVSMDREHGIMTVATAGNYDKSLKNPSWAIYPDLVFPALIRK